MGLLTNTSKTKAETCIDGKIRTRLSADSYYRSRAGFATQKEWESRRVECDICGADLSAASLSSHLMTQHDVYRSKVIDKDLVVEREPVVYTATTSGADGKLHCPVPGCVGEAYDRWNLRRHFCDRHPMDLVSTPGEGVYPQCESCGMQTNPTVLNAGHPATKLCREGTERKVQRDAAANSARALDVTFTAYDVELERVEVFKYLGRLVAMDDNDVQAVRSNIKKARKCWKMLSRLLRSENMEPRVCGMFYKAVVQAVLLFGSETWVLTPSTMQALCGFHIRSTYRMAREHAPRKDPQSGEWHYPSSALALEEVGLHTIEHYVQVRRQTIAAYIVDRPIFELCMDGRRRQGTIPRTYWWEQPMDLDLARGAFPAPGVADDEY